MINLEHTSSYRGSRLGVGFVSFINKGTYPQFKNEIGQHWERLLFERAQSIQGVRDEIAMMNPIPPNIPIVFLVIAQFYQK